MNQVDKREKKRKMITEAKIYPLLWRMAIPSIIGMMVFTLYSVTDTFFVAKLDKSYLTAAIGIVFSFVSVIQAISFWFGYGAGNYISRQLGAKNVFQAETMLAVVIFISIMTGLTILGLGLLFLEPLAKLLGGGVSPNIMEATTAYLKIILIAVPFMLVANVLYNVLRLQGSASDAMFGALVGVGLNIILDPVFIFYFHMGIEGAALASLIGQVIGLGVLWYLTGRHGNVSIIFKRITLDKFYIREMLFGGLPNFSRQGITSISLVLFNHVAGSFGEAAVASVTIVMRLIRLGYAFAIGFGHGFQPICAMNYGAKKYQRIKTAFFYTLATITVYFIAISAVFVFKAENLIGIFSSDLEIKLLGSRILQAQSAVIPFMGYYILTGMFLQNIGQFGTASLVTISENAFFFIPLVLLLPSVFGLEGFIYSKPVSSICALLFSIYIGKKSWHKHLNDGESGRI